MLGYGLPIARELHEEGPRALAVDCVRIGEHFARLHKEVGLQNKVKEIIGFIKTYII